MKGLLKKLAKWLVSHGLDELNKELARKRENAPPPPFDPRQPPPPR